MLKQSTDTGSASGNLLRSSPFTALRTALAMTLVAPVAQAATELKAPVKMLMKEHNQVAVVKAVAKSPDSRIRFEVLEAFHGEPGPEVTIRMDEPTSADVEIDATYVAAFSDVRRNFRFRELRERDPEGFRLLSILGGGPALVDASPAVRLLFQSHAAADPVPSAKLLAAALDAIASHDDRTRIFGTLEISLRPEWLGLIGKDQVARLRGFLDDPSYGPDVRNLLLEVAGKLSDELKDPWLAAEARRTLRELDPQFDLTTFFPRLAMTAIRILGEGGGVPDSSLIGRFLEANNPGVVAAALESLDGLDPSLARSRAAVVLERDDLHAESRRILTEYLG